MSLRVFTNINKDTQNTEIIQTQSVNNLFIKNTGTSAVTLYRVTAVKTDISFTCWLEDEGIKSDKLYANIVIEPGNYIPFYLRADNQSDTLIKSYSIVDINMEYV